MIDSHTHIDLADFDVDREDVIARSIAVGVSSWIVPAISPSSTRTLLAAKWRPPNLYVAAGVHPHEVKNQPDSVLSEIEELLLTHKIVAVGETGLDYHYDLADRDRQIKFFEAHVVLAKRYDKPLIVHARDEPPKAGSQTTQSAYRDILDIIRGSSVCGVLHSFTGDAATATEAFEAGWFVGLNGILTFPKSSALRETVKSFPLDRILLETDAPYLAPVPHRGRRNEPSYLPNVLTTLSEVMQMQEDKLSLLITSNTKRLFSLT